MGRRGTKVSSHREKSRGKTEKEEGRPTTRRLTFDGSLKQVLRGGGKKELRERGKRKGLFLKIEKFERNKERRGLAKRKEGQQQMRDPETESTKKL